MNPHLPRIIGYACICSTRMLLPTQRPRLTVSVYPMPFPLSNPILCCWLPRCKNKHVLWMQEDIRSASSHLRWTFKSISASLGKKILAHLQGMRRELGCTYLNILIHRGILLGSSNQQPGSQVSHSLWSASPHAPREMAERVRLTDWFCCLNEHKLTDFFSGKPLWVLISKTSFTTWHPFSGLHLVLCLDAHDPACPFQFIPSYYFCLFFFCHNDTVS